MLQVNQRTTYSPLQWKPKKLYLTTFKQDTNGPSRHPAEGSKRAKFFEYAKLHSCENVQQIYSAKKYPKGYLYCCFPNSKKKQFLKEDSFHPEKISECPKTQEKTH